MSFWTHDDGDDDDEDDDDDDDKTWHLSKNERRVCVKYLERNWTQYQETHPFLKQNQNDTKLLIIKNDCNINRIIFNDISILLYNSFFS